MSYEPRFTITPQLLACVEEIAGLRERIGGATIEVPWVTLLQKDTRARNVHSSTAIEGNPLTLEQVRALDQGDELPAIQERFRREILNSLAAYRYIEKHSRKRAISHEDVLKLHKIIASKVMHQGEAGLYRMIQVQVGSYLPPPPYEVSGLMFELLEWWNSSSGKLSPVLSSGIVHYRFEAIHPFADGNGRTGRALALWELYRREFDTHHIFSVDEFYWEDRPRYYVALQAVRQQGEDLTSWLEYSAEGLLQTLERAWKRIQQFSARSKGKKLVLRPRQEQLLDLLRIRGGLTPRQIWAGLNISRQGAMDLLRPLMDAGLVRRVGTRKTGRYILG